MADIREMKNQMWEIHMEIEKERNEDLDKIIKKLFEHRIGRFDPQFEFIKEIESDLKAYKFKYR